MKKKQQRSLTGKQARFLRGLGHHLKPLVILGKEGISDSLLASVEAVLDAHELIKIKVGNNCPLDRREVASQLAAKTGGAVAQILGKTILLFRDNQDRDDDAKIRLP